MTIRRTLFHLLLALPLLCGTSVLLADGVVRDGVGAIASGRGGANLAHADNAAIVLENPAGMVNIAGNGLAEIGVDVLVTDLRYADAQNNYAPASNNPVPLPHFGLVKKINDDLAWGFGVFAPAGFGAEYDLMNTTVLPGQSMFHYKSFGALAKITPALAYRVSDRLSVGAQLGVGVSHAELEGPFFLQTGPMRGTPTVLDFQATGAAITWGLGLQYELSENTMLGVSYTGESAFRLDGNARVQIAGLGQSSFDADMNLAWPRSLGIGLAHDLSPRHRLSGDVIWFNWSAAFERLDLTLTGPSNRVFAMVVGNQVRDSLPLHWRDTISARLGYEYMLCDCRTLRLGYVYHRNPVPNSMLTAFIPGILEHAISVGAEQRFAGCTVNVAYQYSFGDQSVANSALAGGDFSNSLVDATAHWAMLSFKWDW